MKKPIRLMEYLATLILPPPRSDPRRLLVPYSGSGSEILGALNAGWEQIIAVERSLDFAEIAHRRINDWVGHQGTYPGVHLLRDSTTMMPTACTSHEAPRRVVLHSSNCDTQCRKVHTGCAAYTCEAVSLPTLFPNRRTP